MFPLSQLVGSPNRNCENYVWVCRQFRQILARIAWWELT